MKHVSISTLVRTLAELHEQDEELMVGLAQWLLWLQLDGEY